MPIYEFECLACESRFERLCGISSGANGVKCPECGGAEVKRLMSGFYSRSSGDSGSHSGSCNCGGCHKSSCAGCHH